MKVERVPLAVDAQVRYSLGPMQLPLRALVLLATAFPPALWSLGLPIPGSARLVIPVLVLSTALAVAAPTVEGIWAVAYLAFRALARVLPALIDGDGEHPARVGWVGEVGVSVMPSGLPRRLVQVVEGLGVHPRAGAMVDGLFSIRPGGWRAILCLDAPAVSTAGDEYGAWCDAVVTWLTSVGVPAQLHAVAEHHDRVSAEHAFDASYRGRDIPLRGFERQLVGEVAAQTLALRHYVVLNPSTAGPDGIPLACRWRWRGGQAVRQEDADRALQSALRLVANHGLRAVPAGAEEVRELLRQTPLLSDEAVNLRTQVRMDGQYHAFVSVKALPPTLHAGAVVDTLLRTRMRGTASLYLAPVAPQVARKKISVMRQAYQHVAARSSEVDARVMLGDIENLAADLAARHKTAHVVAVSLCVKAETPAQCEELTEKVIGSLDGDGLRPVRCTVPGFWPALAATPGCAPLRRSLMLTTDGVAACLLPALGTPFGDSMQPLVGLNVQTGTPAYLSVFHGRKNHNLLCVGTSGAGKSVALKTLVYRHACRGARLAIVDPDSEYGDIMRAVGGVYIELGRHAINVLDVDPGLSADDSAGRVLPALSVMAGNEVGLSPEGHPVRRLPEEDKGWLHGELALFFESWREAGRDRQPVISDLLAHLSDVSMRRAMTEPERQRCRVVMFRLQTFTQGARGRVFDRPTSFSLGGEGFAIGLRELAMQYRADLTPALAIILGFVMGDLVRRRSPMLILVDEAHHVTTDPDAGMVLARLVRQARKYGAGVWMASQQVEDFLSREGLGRTLAATAATKLILGLEASMGDDAREAFKLTEAEASWLVEDCPAGRAVLVSGDERGVIDIRPGAHLLALARTIAPALDN